MTPAERLKAARHALDLTTSEMAAAVGLQGRNAKDDLRKMEDGARPVTGPVLVAAEALALLVEIRNGGLIYWEPRTSRGAVAKAAMTGRIDAMVQP